MFFIFASPRSGTTLLTSCLNLHSGIFIPHETDFIIPSCFVFDRIKDPEIGKRILKDLIPNTTRFSYTIGGILSSQEISSIIEESPYEPRQLFSNIYSRLAEKSGKLIGGDKSPNDLLNIYMFYSLGILNTETKVVHLIRDIRDVILSLQNVKWVANIEEFFPRFWCDSNLFLHNSLKSNSDRYLLLRYEDLVTDPTKELKQVCSFLGMPFEEAILDKSQRGCWYWKFDYHQKLKNDFSRERIGVWKTELDSRSVQLCHEQAAEALNVFGY